MSNIEHLDRIRRTTRAGALADHDPRDFRYCRNQREAGIEHLEWEDRIKPIRPIWLFVMSGACWGVFGLAIAWTMNALF
jgi:hypothetical protein